MLFAEMNFLRRTAHQLRDVIGRRFFAMVALHQFIQTIFRRGKEVALFQFWQQTLATKSRLREGNRDRKVNENQDLDPGWILAVA